MSDTDSNVYCIIHGIRFQIVCDVEQCALCYEDSLVAYAKHATDVRETKQLDEDPIP